MQSAIYCPTTIMPIPFYPIKAHFQCDSSIVDIDGSSALKIALEAGNRDIGVLLYAHEHVNRGTSPYSSIRRSRRGSKPTTPTGPSPSAPRSIWRLLTKFGLIAVDP
ncbi:hypothetical protein HZH66_014072 [Vespula vulgaris]|uniref:Uncharacterized protein n=1 Tax=Vespula vulgaris TaxID=7454 RepID=A0A834J3Z8_VESVU|nr:hypothetical protein HZH66_014072 [Vespula vulgaris]